MAETPTSHRKSLLESPWYWVYLFCAAALVGLLLAGPKFSRRQAQIERKYQARQRAIQQIQGETPSTPMSTEDDTAIRLWPLYQVFALLFAVSWVFVWRTHFRGRRDVEDGKEGPPSDMDS